MNVTTLSEPDVTRVELEGSIDGKTAPQIREELSASLQQVRKLLIDMSRVDYLSSAGLRLLLLLYREITYRKGQLVLVGVSTHTIERRLFHACQSRGWLWQTMGGVFGDFSSRNYIV